VRGVGDEADELEVLLDVEAEIFITAGLTAKLELDPNRSV
jgi:hypothetical protein